MDEISKKNKLYLKIYVFLIENSHMWFLIVFALLALNYLTQNYKKKFILNLWSAVLNFSIIVLNFKKNFCKYFVFLNKFSYYHNWSKNIPNLKIIIETRCTKYKMTSRLCLKLHVSSFTKLNKKSERFSKTV